MKGLAFSPLFVWHFSDLGPGDKPFHRLMCYQPWVMKIAIFPLSHDGRRQSGDRDYITPSRLQ
jgi:hypothetical protein